MTKLLVQHGPAKGQKIEKALKNNNVEGVIFSLREEKIESINNYINNVVDLNENNSFIDPQFYYSTYDKGNIKNLENVFNFPVDVYRRDMRTKDERIYKYFDEYEKYVSEKYSSIITPGFSIDSIDWKFDSSLDIYKYFKNKNNFQNYYMTLLISSKMFHSKNDIEEIILDIIDETKEYDNNGIYLIINYEELNDSNYEKIDSETLSNILYFIYKLKKNNYNIMVGYAYINSILFAMLNCDFVSSGWFNNLRKFTNSKFENIDNFGRRKKKFFSIPLLSNINLETIRELKPFYDVNNLKSNTHCDDLEHQFWEAESNILKLINEKTTIEEKIKYIKQLIIKAISLSDEIQNNIPDEFIELKNIIKGNTSHLKEWLFAIDLFIKKALILIY